ncbi:NAD-dependent succinate-semialdehyde dehydrogenase [Panacibacter ginsenosidivorans]|uniref:NAD-dependent succinate-semialdehyde dehydrogenase n=1 Tax=Panacibacter ginsenosidivorans TaxID=1813871 RepID=A0A5B8V3Z5_9BACT|nr:NAD-dependent succinate-semialdehyde dehydrogenase [Panacibacter ginsenosidivorans]QEC66104.1 NAD-dependent succinate-semialdehyde dehydrogenase [Panacibacter ginsenosidivorans]
MNIFKSIFPYTLETIAEYEVMSVAKVEACLAQSAIAFKYWRKTSFAERSKLMLRVADLLTEHRDEYATLITNEMGKVLREAKAEVEKCAACCRHYAAHAESFLKDIDQPSDASKSYVSFEPIGAVLAIMPWNFPFWQVFRFAAPYLMAGNVALLKHAPNVCGVALAIEKLFVEAGFAEGVFQTLIVDVDVVEKIIDHDIVQGITLTGSELAGSKVGALAGKAIKKSVLELGGSDVVIVLEDADMQKAAQVATLSRMQNAGQSCIAAKRFITVGSAKNTFTQAVQNEIAKLKQGNPFDESITTGPMARIDLAEKIEEQFKASLSKGAQLVTGGDRNNCNFTPALLVHVHEGMPAFDEEVFGPMASIIEAKDEAAAIRFANDHRYGLGAAIWSKDTDKAQSLAKQIEAGAVFINALVKSDPRYPFGGIKKSGYGRELSYFGIHEFMNIKTIYVG